MHAMNTQASTLPTSALDLVRTALSKHSETPITDMYPDTKLVDIGIDSLALGELLFALEDTLEVELTDTSSMPETIADVMTLIQPFLDSAKLS
jgi:acyl carrier protein